MPFGVILSFASNLVQTVHHLSEGKEEGTGHILITQQYT